MTRATERTCASPRQGHRMGLRTAALMLVSLLLACELGAQDPGQELGTAIRGRLVLERRQRLSDWRVLAAPRLFPELPRDAAGRPAGTRPKANGKFVLERLAPGLVYVCPYVGGRLAPDSVVPVRVTQDQEPGEEVRLTAKSPRARVAFALVREDGTPLGREVKVHLYNTFGEVDRASGGPTSDAAGIVRFQRLPCGRYDLWVEGPVEPMPPDADPLPAALFRGLEVTSGRRTQKLDLTVPRSGAVKGRLLLADGKTPARGYMVAVQSGTVPDAEAPVKGWAAAYARGAQSCYAQAEVGPDGAFVLQNLTPGQHSLDIRRPGEREARYTVADVQVEAGEVTDLGNVVSTWDGWQYMFDRETLAGWEESDFYDPAEVRIENDRIVLPMGNDMTGIRWTRYIPRQDYEVSLEAMRVAGDDFFCGLTFPVGNDFCSLILGGWGGGLVGLSSLDGFDAAENETSRWVQFENQRWYRVRLRVSLTRIEAWLDHDRIVDVAVADREVSTRIEVEASKPFGIATWRTTGAIRDIRMRRSRATAP
ncbi:MAG: family 16 glycoside hydrolase [Armatimonadota bacterium]